MESWCSCIHLQIRLVVGTTELDGLELVSLAVAVVVGLPVFLEYILNCGNKLVEESVIATVAIFIWNDRSSTVAVGAQLFTCDDSSQVLL